MAAINAAQILDLAAPARYRQEVEIFLAGSAITLGQWVSFDSSRTGTDRALYVVPSLGTGAVEGGDPRVCGVALTAQATVGSPVQVVTSGYAATAQVATGTAVDQAVYCDGTAAGRAVALVTVDDDLDAAPNPPAAGRELGIPCGVTLALAAGNVAPVMVKRF